MLAAARDLPGRLRRAPGSGRLSLLTTTFTDPAERNKAFGICGAIAGSGASVGLILGGVLTQTLSWRYSMYVNLIFATIADRRRARPASQSGPGGQAEARHPGRR